LRRIWELLYTFCSDYLSAISGTSPIYDELCRHFFNFITKCISSASKLIRFVIGNAIYCARVQSPVGRNYVLCYERYGSKVQDEFRSGIKSS